MYSQYGSRSFIPLDDFKGKAANFFINCELKYSYQKCGAFEPGINFTTYLSQKKILSEGGLYLNYDIKFAKQKVIYGPKAGLGFMILFKKLRGIGFNAKASLVSYNAFDNADVRFMPEAGLTYFGVLNLNYSYSLPLNNTVISEIGNHQINIGINVGYWRTILNLIMN